MDRLRKEKQNNPGNRGHQSQNHKRQQSKLRIKKWRQRTMATVCLAVLAACSLYAFLLGKSVGAKEAWANRNYGGIYTNGRGEENSEPENLEAENSETENSETENSETENSETAEEAGNPVLKRRETENGMNTWSCNDENVLVLVNKENPLPEDYEVELLTLPDGVNRAAMAAYEPLCEMLEAGRREGLYFEICSSYRDVERQRELFEEDLRVFISRGYSYMDAYEEVAKETMPPGCSEHSTGLAFDIVAADYQMLDEGQERTPENKWLLEHCAEYGFILRYPEGKENMTAISHESWHFRYVGREAASYIMENELTLEEYLGIF